jgi:hypothetical protein
MAEGDGGMTTQEMLDTLLDLRNLAGNLWMEEDVRLMQSEIDNKMKEIQK